MPAIVAFGAVLAHVAFNAGISARAVAATRPVVARIENPQMIVAGEVPLTSWKRQVRWRGEKFGGMAEYNGLTGELRPDSTIYPLNLDDPRLVRAIRSDPKVRDFLFWSRMPYVIERDGRAYLSDQRFPALRSVGFMVPLDNH